MEESNPQRFSIAFALFNSHRNDAEKRARAEMEKACPELLAEVDQIISDGDGIMAILNLNPSPATAYFAALITYFVNEGID